MHFLPPLLSGWGSCPYCQQLALALPSREEGRQRPRLTPKGRGVRVLRLRRSLSFLHGMAGRKFISVLGLLPGFFGCPEPSFAHGSDGNSEADWFRFASSWRRAPGRPPWPLAPDSKPPPSFIPEGSPSAAERSVCVCVCVDGYFRIYLSQSIVVVVVV